MQHTNLLECPVRTFVLDAIVCPKTECDVAVCGVVITDALVPIEVDGCYAGSGVGLNFVGASAEFVEFVDRGIYFAVGHLYKTSLCAVTISLVVAHPFVGCYIVDVVSVGFVAGGIKGKLGIVVLCLRGRCGGVAVVVVGIHHGVAMLWLTRGGQCLAHLDASYSLDSQQHG